MQAEQPLLGMELIEKKHTKVKVYRKSVKRKNLQLRDACQF